MISTIFRVEKRVDTGQRFLFASVGMSDPDPIEIEIVDEPVLVQWLDDLQKLSDDHEKQMFGTTIRVVGSIPLRNEEEFWTIANDIYTVGAKIGGLDNG